MSEKEMKDKYRQRLKSIIGKKMDTTMIFPLSQFEAMFGHLWKHGVPESQLTEEEKMYRQKWQACRKNIMDNGNRQKRNAYAEIDMHDVVWNRYQVTFLPMDKITKEN